VDWQLLLPLGFVLLASSGFLSACLALIHYFRSDEIRDLPQVSIAMTAFGLQYLLVFTMATLSNQTLLPTILIFLTLMALGTAIRLGAQAHTPAGSRITLAGALTLASYICALISSYDQNSKLYR
jgi:hypothetical protein